MKRVFTALLNTALALFVAAVAAASYYKLRVTFHDFDTVAVRADGAAGGDTQGRQLDRILLSNLRAFEYIRSFDHLLAGKPFTHNMNTLWADRCEVRQENFYKFAKWQALHRPPDIAAPGQPGGWTYYSASQDHKISGRLAAPANGVS